MGLTKTKPQCNTGIPTDFEVDLVATNEHNEPVKDDQGHHDRKEYHMAIHAARMECDLYAGAFSGEVVFAVSSIGYEGIAPKHYAEPNSGLSQNDPRSGTVRVVVKSNGGKTAVVAVPDGNCIEVAASLVVG